MAAPSNIILASASPRRAYLLETLGLTFEVDPAHIDETAHPGEPPADFVERIALEKARAVAGRHTRGFVIAADTVVVIQGRVLGKPTTVVEAVTMLGQLSGQWHAVMTGVALVDVERNVERVGHEKTLVRFRDLDAYEIETYVATGEPLDKAGGYAIQGRASMFAEEIAGNYHNVVGLPINLLDRLARQIGYRL
jgi:septum formation protein